LNEKLAGKLHQSALRIDEIVSALRIDEIFFWSIFHSKRDQEKNYKLYYLFNNVIFR
jgi:hypothetical protein